MMPQLEIEVAGIQHWLSHQAFADAGAFGQIPLAPGLVVAALMGYKVERRAAAVARVGALLPSFVMTLIAALSFLNRVRTNHQFQVFLSGVVPAVVGMLAAAVVSLARSGLDSALSFGVATIAFLLLLRAKLNPVVIYGWLWCGAIRRGSLYLLTRHCSRTRGFGRALLNREVTMLTAQRLGLKLSEPA